MRKVYYFLKVMFLLGGNCCIFNENIFCQNREYSLNDFTNWNKIDWREQLAIPINKPDSLLIKSGLALLQFQEKYILTDINQLAELKKRLFYEDNFFPVSEDNMSKILLLRRSDINDLIPAQYNFSNIIKDLNTLITLGMKVVELQWIYQGRLIYTECIVSEDTGFVYDNIISHVLIPSPTIITNRILKED